MSRNQESFENARIGFKNFAGAEGPFNKAGDRSFHIFLDDARAAQLEADGWNVKYPKVNDAIVAEEDTREAHMEVSVSYKFYPPKVVLISGKNLTVLEESELDMLDWAEIESVDIVIRPYSWTVSGKSGIKAYLKAMYVTIKTDAFSEKYGI